MYLSSRFMSYIAVMLLAMSCSNLLAQDPPLPEDQRIRYAIREVPTDPSSAVIWTIDLALEAEDSDGGSVGWLIDSVTVTEVDASGEPTSMWTDVSPELDSPDGLWWVEHADPADPEPADFALPPLLGGTASVELGAQADLEYTLEGRQYVPEAGSPLSELVVTGLDYVFTLVGESLPLDEGDDEPEPVTIDDAPDQPAG